MKRELAAGLLLLALICGAIYNIFYVGELVRDISAELYASQEELAARGPSAKAGRRESAPRSTPRKLCKNGSARSNTRTSSCATPR